MAIPSSHGAPSLSIPPSARFAELSERILDAWLADNPALGRQLGLHAYDGRLADYSAQAIEARVARLRATKAELATVDSAQLGPDGALDLAILRNQVELALFQYVALREWQTRPMFYDELFSVDAYVNRAYAPIELRAERLVAHEEAALVALPNVLRNLKSPMSKPVVETSARIFAGYAEYLRGDVVKLFGQVGSEELRRRFTKANTALAAAADELARHLRDVELPRADDSHVLGRARFQELLRAQEGLTLPLSELKRMGEDDLAKNKQAYEALRPRVHATRPRAAELREEAAKLVAQSRAFIVDQHLVTIPTSDEVGVKETPPYMRWNAAFLDPPGPFETSKEAFYYITEPDPAWPLHEQEAYVMTRGILLSTTVHEVYPGHFLQGQWERRAPTRTQKTFGSYSFIEGWAHYAEELIVSEGFGASDPQNRLGQLSDALLRNVRLLVALGIHTEGMSIEQAERRFRDDAFQDDATAREQAARGAFDPGYFAYTLGKLQILELRTEARARLGQKFDLQRFHDALLSHGSPPVPLIRERVLSDLARDSSGISR
jgi:uncharacterized protein (DUF885 family)